MPLYEYKCKKCGKHEDKFNRMVDHKVGPVCCGQVMGQFFNSSVVVFKEFVTDHITGDPVRVTSEKQHQKLLKENNLAQSYGKGWV